MKSEDFVKIFYSNFTLNIDWANIDEIAWMYEEKLFSITDQIIASNNAFLERINSVSDPKKGFIRNGDSDAHLALKSLAKDYLIKYCGVPENDIHIEYPFIGFEVDIIDKDLYFPVECGDTNALKLEKYLYLPTTKKVMVLPYPHSKDLKIFEFSANPKFFEYIRHKQNFLNKQRSRFR